MSITNSITKLLNMEDRNKFKKYWRLILKSRFDIDGGSWKKFRCFKNLMTEIDVLDYLLKKDEILSNTYDVYQDLLYYLQKRDYVSFDKILKEQNDNISKQMKISINSLKYFSEYIKIHWNMNIIMELWNEIIILVNL